MTNQVELILAAANRAQPEHAQKFSNWLYHRAANTTQALMNLPEDKKELRAQALVEVAQSDIARELTHYCSAVGGCSYNEVMAIASKLLNENSELFLSDQGL
ncbi:hypothetical protein AB9R81_08595 [Vibrio cyclitrophicus]|uniref:hypothetical protein n=1 Tax=Vibrio cyclitrophicus TaxID=47951 RepID=UPI000C81E99E|nr:hypothetical protein [Vibrio cyclitrophicus]MBU2932427.1 hypothetical protein [Vibrio cyclitrophicus]PMI07538.1 hypothetical protein BCU52_15615 [Vibrio cyclitrophicus]